MLGRLMKHELRATGRLMLPLFLVTILLALFARISTRVLDRNPQSILNVLNVLLIAAFVIAMIVVAVFSVVLMVSRFYKNLMTDEGYLMFTLPVSTHQLLWSKLLVSAIWFIATFLVEALAVLILAYEGGLFQDILRGVRGIFVDLEQAGFRNTWVSIMELLLLTFVTLLVSCLNFYAPIAVGHSFANKKVFWSVVFYFINGAIWQVVTVFLGIGGVNVFSARFAFDQNFAESPTELLRLMHTLFLSGLGYLVVMGAVLYFVTWYMLRYKRNLQ